MCLFLLEAIEKKGVDFLKDYLTLFGGWPLLLGRSWRAEAFNWIDVTKKLFDNGFSTDTIVNIYIAANVSNTSQRIIEVSRYTFLQHYNKQSSHHDYYY